MQTTFLKRAEDNPRLLIFFTGWGTTDEVAKHLTLPDACDYLTAYDYRTLEGLPEIGSYEEVYIVGWSMGVWALDCLAPQLPTPTKAIAINGTPIPMSDSYGIPSKIFQGTLEGLDDTNRERFNRRMCGGKQLLSVYNSFAARSTSDLREELYGTYLKVKEINPDTPPQLPWTLALVSEKDLVVPPENQIAYWSQHHIPTDIISGVGHYPLQQFHKWQELLQL